MEINYFKWMQHYQEVLRLVFEQIPEDNQTHQYNQYINVKKSCAIGTQHEGTEETWIYALSFETFYSSTHSDMEPSAACAQEISATAVSVCGSDGEESLYTGVDPFVEARIMSAARDDIPAHLRAPVDNCYREAVNEAKASLIN